MKFEIKGTDQLIQKLHNSMNMDRIKEVVRNNGAEMENKMKRKAAVDTGFMRRSVNMTLHENGMTVSVMPTAHYSVYVEYGTRKMSAQPFVRPSYHEQKQQFIKDMKRVMK